VKQVDSARRKAGPLVWLAADKLGASKLGADCVAGHARVVWCHALGDLQRPSPLQSPAAHLKCWLELECTVGEKFHQTTRSTTHHAETEEVRLGR
jgi:hypothetical protein